MIAKAKKHFWYYFSFAALQLLGLVLVSFTSYDKPLQMAAIWMTTGIYIFWALLHQYIHHHLSAKIVAEYVLMGTLGLTVSLVLFG